MRRPHGGPQADAVCGAGRPGAEGRRDGRGKPAPARMNAAPRRAKGHGAGRSESTAAYKGGGGSTDPSR